MDRRGFLECMAWAGSGVVWSMAGGVATSSVLGAPSRAAAAAGAFTFAQISDTHVGYKGAANPDALVTLQQSIARINAARSGRPWRSRRRPAQRSVSTSAKRGSAGRSWPYEFTFWPSSVTSR